MIVNLAAGRRSVRSGRRGASACNKLKPMKGPFSCRRVVLSVIAILGSASALVAQPLDTFYERLYQDGRRSAAAGLAGRAAQELRFACFGMLESPDRLGDCLARLALAQAESGAGREFLDTAERLVEVERRFQGYSRSSLPQAERRRFELELEARAPVEIYNGVTAFKSIAERRRAAEIRRLPAEERMTRLNREITQEPRNLIWRVMLGDLMLEQGRAPEAIETAERLLAERPGEASPACLRGRAQAILGACDDRSLKDLRRCEGLGQEPAAAARKGTLRCHVQTGDWAAASALLGGLSAEEQQDPEVKALAKQVRQGRRTSSSTEGDVESRPTNRESPATDVSTPASPTPGDVEREVLSAGWEILHADARDRFEDTYDSIRALADRYPQWAEAQHLTAELAYRLSLWPQAVSYFQRADTIVSEKPNLQFYLAVALYKSGDREAALMTLDRCVPLIQPSDFVKYWVERIRSDGP